MKRHSGCIRLWFSVYKRKPEWLKLNEGLLLFHEEVPKQAGQQWCGGDFSLSALAILGCDFYPQGHKMAAGPPGRMSVFQAERKKRGWEKIYSFHLNQPS